MFMHENDQMSLEEPFCSQGRDHRRLTRPLEGTAFDQRLRHFTQFLSPLRIEKKAEIKIIMNLPSPQRLVYVLSHFAALVFKGRITSREAGLDITQFRALKHGGNGRQGQIKGRFFVNFHDFSPSAYTAAGETTMCRKVAPAHVSLSQISVFSLSKRKQIGL